MITDYESFLHVAEDGRIWWLLKDAIKLGAGYLPIRDDDRNLVPVLHAPSNRVRANEKTLIGAFGNSRYTMPRPDLLDRDGFRFVDAGLFLEWLAQYLTLTQCGIAFPDELVRAVRAALDAAPAPPAGASKKQFESLTLALDGRFEMKLDELPVALRQRVEKECFPMPWDSLSADQRHCLTLQVDYKHDPATAQDRQFWWDLYIRKDAIEKQIVQWEAVATPTASDMALKETRLKELRQELAHMEREERQPRGDYHPERKRPDSPVGAPAVEQELPIRYIAYPKAMKALAERLHATPEEIAAWIWMGQSDDSFAAYLNANELDPPPRFYYIFGNGGNFDYLAPLMACWFREDDITQFDPADRYITGKALIERWGGQPGIQPEAFIRAKIAESRLLDGHPIYGGTQGTFPEDASFPPLTSGLFVLSHVEQIEAEDFGVDLVPPVELGDATQAETKPDEQLIQANAKNPCAVFLAMPKLRASELTIAFVGDKPEHGVGANNMLEISARKKTKRVALAALDLVNRQRGILNGEGIILLGMARKAKLTAARKGASAKIKRLRAVFRTHLGICDDPFTLHRKGAGWEPHFMIEDRRGAADERAKRDAEDHRTVSFEQMLEFGEKATNASSMDESSDLEPNAADEWIEKSGHNWQDDPDNNGPA